MNYHNTKNQLETSYSVVQCNLRLAVTLQDRCRLSFVFFDLDLAYRQVKGISMLCPQRSGTGDQGTLS